MLGDIAAGADGEEDVLSSGLVDFLPMEVQFNDPPMKAMLDECGAMWELLQEVITRKQELHQRKLAELRRVREQHEEKSREAEALRNRMQSAKQSLSKKLEDEYLASQQLRNQIFEERTGIQQLRASLASAMEELTAREQQLEQASASEDAAQASLIPELQAATDEQACLQSELEVAKSALHRERRRSVDLKASVAEEQSAAEDSEVRLRSELRDASGRRASLDAPGSPFGGGLQHLADVAEQQDEADGDPDTEALRASRLRQCCLYQMQQLETLRAELAEEEASEEELGAQLVAMREVISADAASTEPLYPASSGFSGPDASAWQEHMGYDATATAHEVEALYEELSQREHEVLAVAREEREARDVLQGQLSDLADLQEQLLNEEDACAEHEQALAEANMGLEELQSEVMMEHDTLRQEEHSSEKRRQMFRALIQEQSLLLSYTRTANNQLYQQRRKKGSKFRFGSTPKSRTSKGSHQSPSFHMHNSQEPGHSPGVASDGWQSDGLQSPGYR